MRRLRLVAVGLAVAGCGALPPAVTWDSTRNLGCTLEPVTGTLVDIGGRTVLTDGHWLEDTLQDRLFVRWPTGWDVRSSLGGLDVVNPTGTVQYRTASTVSLPAAAAPPEYVPRIEEGALLICPL
jgi:hypothetical protein